MKPEKPKLSRDTTSFEFWYKRCQMQKENLRFLGHNLYNEFGNAAIILNIHDHFNSGFLSNL